MILYLCSNALALNFVAHTYAKIHKQTSILYPIIFFTGKTLNQLTWKKKQDEIYYNTDSRATQIRKRNEFINVYSKWTHTKNAKKKNVKKKFSYSPNIYFTDERFLSFSARMRLFFLSICVSSPFFLPFFHGCVLTIMLHSTFGWCSCCCFQHKWNFPLHYTTTQQYIHTHTHTTFTLRILYFENS